MTSNPQVGLVLDMAHLLNRGVLSGIHRYAQLHGPWDLHLTANPKEIFSKHPQYVKFSGLIASINAKLLKPLSKIDLPIVLISQEIHQNLSTLTINNAAVSKLAAHYFLERGFRHFAFCTSLGRKFMQERMKYFCDEIGNANFNVDCFHVKGWPLRDWLWEHDATRLKPWLLQLPKPCALVAINDYVGTQVIRACLDLQIQVPEEISVLSMNNNIELCQVSKVPLSSIEMGWERIGFYGAGMLEQIMKGKSRKHKIIQFNPLGVVTRRSTDTAAAEDPRIAKALQYLLKNTGHPLHINELLRVAGMSRRSFEIAFKKARGRSPYEEILHVRINEAKRYLSETLLPIQDIATHCGFDAKQLSVAFRKTMKMTPIAYRKQHRANQEGLLQRRSFLTQQLYG